MNARTPAQHMAAQQLEWLPLKSIAPSASAFQQRRRQRFTDATLAELIDSVRAAGIMVPLLVRPMPEGTSHRLSETHELVAGERRYLAAQAAGLEHVPAVVRAITDEELLIVQLTENKHRDALHPLEEAEGYRELMAARHATAEEAAALVGVSRTQVYNRLKLLEIGADVQAALEAGEIDASKALLLARLPGHKLQKKALKLALERRYGGEPVSYRELSRQLRTDFMVRLNDVPFALDNAELHERGACTTCPHFSGNDPELQAELDADHQAGTHVCTDRACHDVKVINHYARIVQSARASGRRVIEGDEAKALKPQRWRHAPTGWVDLDDPCPDIPEPENAPDDWQPPTYRELLKGAKKLPLPALFIDPHAGRAIDVLPVADLAPLLKKHGVVLEAAPADEPREPSDPAAHKREQEKAAARHTLELAWREQLLRLIHAKWKGPLKRDDWEAIADCVTANADINTELYGEAGPHLAKMSETELQRLLVEFTVMDCVEYPHQNPGRLLALAKRFRIDPAKVKKQVKAELEKAA